MPRTAVVAAIAALGLTAGLGVSTTASAPVARAAAPDVRTFDAEPLGAPPAGYTTQGDITVAEAPFGPPGNRAVHLADYTASLQSRLQIPAPAAAARRFEFDFAMHTTRQAVFVAVHGAGDNPALGTYRFMINPVYPYGGSTTAQVSVYDGRQYLRLATVPMLTARDHASRVRIDASTEAAVLTVNGMSFRTTTRASGGSAITGLELASSGAAGVGSDAYLDDVAVRDLDPAGPALAEGLPVTGVLPSYVAQKHPASTVVATIDAPDVRAAQVRAEVVVDGVDEPFTGRVHGEAGHLLVSAPIDGEDIGLHPVTVTVTDLRTGVTRSTQMRIQAYSPIPAQVVAQEPAGAAEPRFPDAVRLADGTIVLAYHYADGHTSANGVVRMVRSTDGGATWTDPVTVAATPGADNRDPKLSVLSDGTVLLTVFRTDWSTRPESNLGTFVYRSADGGLTFPEVTQIESAQPGAWQHGPAVELLNGDILQPLYGYGARVARSTDGGRTFPAANELTVVEDDERFSNGEPNIVRLPSGELVMQIRRHDNVLGIESESVLVRSYDDGRTWTAPEPTGLPASSAHLLLTDDGSVLMTYGNYAQPGRPTYGVLIADPSGSWTRHRPVPLYNSGWEDQANPTSVQLDDGSFLSFGFDVANRTVVSFRTTAADYD
ncbi:sialidase family protein [Jiangella rhizosphaerae]|uniref:Exo-alpha-sialidase n=1 Tax=Jiangella rhizosphaerae TaxID=2293569 RepID=A0A418KFX1_9ACTN|nr:sialidase family protein [Jiangella rhizosphaerae]RIQ10822.1 exo-alpha-sialidase [Jiangella rhizosphaerae]